VNHIIPFLIEVALTLTASLLLTGYLRPHLRRVLVDLCGTEERAQFWTVFSNILLVGFPMLFSLGYTPESGSSEGLFFEIIGRVSGNMGVYLTALVGVGIVVTFFALVAPRPARAEQK
jgi:hypothetical protein